MEVRLLGPVSLWHEDRELALVRAHRRCLLAALALTPGRTIAADILIDRVWGDAPPREARHSLYAHVSALRRLLQQCGDGAVLSRQGGGYALEIDPDAVDLHHARRLADAARSRDGDTSRSDRARLELFRQACARWRGMPLGGVTSEWARRVRDGLDQERVALLVERFTLELRLGEHAAAVGPLSTLLADYPLMEPLAALQMLALYRCGRHPEALALYAQTRQRLIDEIGADPGTELQQLHERILRRDPSLALPRPRPEPAASATSPASTTSPASAAPAVPAHPPLVPAQLPAAVAAFTGRDGEVRQLDELLLPGPDDLSGPVALVVLAGTAGVGKSALAIQWAHRVRDRFPDGQLFVQLRGHARDAPRPPLAVLTSFLRALGVPAHLVPPQLDDAAAMFRSTVADRRLLVVLDDAASAEQVRPLMPGGPGSAVLVTSRDQLHGLVARDGARSFSLPVLPVQEAVALLHRLLPGGGRLDPATATAVAERCGKLPLALRVAAANLTLPGQQIDEYLRQLTDDRDRLAALTVPGDPTSAVSSALDFSYRRRPAAGQRMFRLLSLAPGDDVCLPAAARLADVPLETARRLLADLVTAHLVEQPIPGRYRCHDLVREYAADLTDRFESLADQQAARDRVHDFYLAGAAAAARQAHPQVLRLPGVAAAAVPDPALGIDNAASGLAWFEAERTNLIAAIRAAAASGSPDRAWTLADCLRGHFWFRMCTPEWEEAAQTALAAAERAGDPHAQAACHLSLAGLRTLQCRHVDAAGHAETALSFADQGEWPEGQAAALSCQATIAATRGDTVAAIALFHRALARCERAGWQAGHAVALTNLGSTYLEAGRLTEARHYSRRALVVNTELDAGNGRAINLTNLGAISHLTGQHQQARRYLTRAWELCERIGSRSGQCASQRWLAEVELGQGRLDVAHRLATNALTLAGAHGHRRFEADALNVLGKTELRMGDPRQAAARFGQALTLAEQAGHDNPRAGAEALLGLAETALADGELTLAHHHAERARELARQACARVIEAEALGMSARIRFADGQTATAQAYGEQALSVHRASGHWLGELQTVRMLREASEHSGATPTGRRRPQPASS